MHDREALELEQYLAISRAVAGELDFQKVLNRIAGVVKSKLLRYDHMDVAVLLPGDRSKHLAFETGMETFWGRNGKHQTNALSPIRQLLAGETDLLFTSDAWDDPRFHFDGAVDGPIFEANLRSRIHVPMYVHGEILGALNISSHEKDAYDDHDIQIARNISDLIAPYFFALNMGEQARASALAEGAARGREQSIRTGAQKLTDAMEAERQRLGMELHDQTLADLSAIYRRVSRMANEQTPDVRELQQVSTAISQCTVELRRIIENAKPGVLEFFGLAQAIEAQLDRATQGLDRRIATSVTDATDNILDRMDDRIRLAVFRIVQEAVTNAIKHSACGAIDVSLTRKGDVIEVTVSNDGRVPAEGWRSSNRGVDNIRARADLIGAEIDFDRDQDRAGSRTVLSIPIGAVGHDAVESPETAVLVPVNLERSTENDTAALSVSERSK